MIILFIYHHNSIITCPPEEVVSPSALVFWFGCYISLWFFFLLWLTWSIVLYPSSAHKHQSSPVSGLWKMSSFTNVQIKRLLQDNIFLTFNRHIFRSLLSHNCDWIHVSACWSLVYSKIIVQDNWIQPISVLHVTGYWAAKSNHQLTDSSYKSV